MKMMTRLIDADVLKEQVMSEIRRYWNEDGGGYYLAEDVIPDIENAPTVEVVQCKECKHNRCCSIQDAMNWTPRLNIGKWFCSFGEKK